MPRRNKTHPDETDKLLKKCSGPCNLLKYFKEFGLKSKTTNYKNLRPMWAEHNMSKGDNLPNNYREILEQIEVTLKC